MFDDNDLCIFCLPVSCTLLVGHALFDQLLCKVKLFSGAHDNVCFFCYDGIVDGNLICVLPVIFSVINIKDDLCVYFLCEHNCFDCCFSGRTLCKSSSGDEDRFCIFDVVLVDVVYMKLQVCDTVTVHEDAAFLRRKHLCKGKPQFLSVCTFGDL